MNRPLMPKSTALWLLKNTSLSKRQISVFCHLHDFELDALASSHLQPLSPLTNDQLTLEEIARCESDPESFLHLNIHHSEKKKQGRRYMPLSKRSEVPNGILWMIQNYPEVGDGQISRLLSSTRTMVSGIRQKKYRLFSQLTPKNPVLLGLCTDQDLKLCLDLENS